MRLNIFSEYDRGLVVTVLSPWSGRLGRSAILRMAGVQEHLDADNSVGSCHGGMSGSPESLSLIYLMVTAALWGR